MQVTAKEAKDKFGEIMAAAGHETVTITKYGRPETAMISVKRLDELEAMEDRYWLELARQGRESGSMGVEASEAYIRSILDAEA
jgi:prevent-host-death family protein